MKSKMKYDGLLLLSGGIDSSVLATKLHSEGKRIRCIFFNGDCAPNKRELASAKRLAYTLGLPFEEFDFRGLMPFLLGLRSFDLAIADMSNPNRKFPFEALGTPMLLSVATYYCQYAAIGTVYIAATKDDADKRKGIRDFFDAWKVMYGHLGDPQIEIETPLIGLSKAEIVQLGDSLDVDLEETWSCYWGGINHCGECGGCLDRKDAYKQTGSLGLPLTDVSYGNKNDYRTGLY